MKNYIFLATYSLHTSPESGFFYFFIFKKNTRKEQIDICSFLLQVFFLLSGEIQRDLEKGPVRSGEIWIKGPCIQRDPRQIFVQIVVDDVVEIQKSTTPATNKKETDYSGD
jgi:hypothetical protein